MKKHLFVLLPCSLLLSGCAFGAAHQAKLNYIHATAALNSCLLANPSTPAACNAQAQVQQNDLSLYTNLTD